MTSFQNLGRVEQAAAAPEVAVPAELAPASRRESLLHRLLAFADVLAIAAALGIAIAFASGRPAFSDFGWGLLTLPGWIFLFKAYGLYDRDGKRVSHSTVDDLPWIFHALLVGSLALWFYFKILPPRQMILREGITFFVVAGIGLFMTRAAARSLAQHATSPERVLFVGGGPMAQLLIQKIRAHPEYRLSPVGYVDVGGVATDDLSRQLPYLGSLDQLEEICPSHRIERLVVAAPAVEEDVLTDLIRSTKDLDLKISILPQFVDVLGPSVEIDNLEGVTLLGINPAALTGSSRFLKRVMDVSIAAPALLVMVPLLSAIALAVKLTSRGPIFYSSERVGRRGRRFRMHKFRTMVKDADGQMEELKRLSHHSSWLLLEHDPRITRVGRFLRHTSLDELPQLLNVLKGDMSLVGPRPMPPDVDEKISGWGRRRLDLTPGITGLWQVLGRTNIPFEEMVKLDYLYVTNWSLWQDVRLLIHTLPAVLLRRGVN